MAHQTEAACLLDSGVSYGTRLLLRSATGDPIFAGFKPGAFSIYIGDAPIYHFDREGRWQRAFVNGLHLLKSLDNNVQSIDRVREGANLVLKRRTLDHNEAEAYDELVRTTVQDVLNRIETGQFEIVEPGTRGRPIAGDVLSTFLRGIVSWDASAWRVHRRSYEETYGPLPFLPPDCPSPVVLQATLGDPHGITFGASGPSPFRVRSAREFELHVGAVAALLGRRAKQSKAVFLGGAEVFRRPAFDILEYLKIINRAFPLAPTGRRRHPDPSEETPACPAGIHGFLDNFSGMLSAFDDWSRFRSLGLVRVSLGIESGCSEIRGMYGKTWSNDELLGTVEAIKAAGIGVSPIVLLGAGGMENAARQKADTAALINALPIGPGDVVSLIDAEEVRASGPGTALRPLPFTPLEPMNHDARRDDFKSMLEPVRALRKARVVPYSLEKQGAV